MRTKFNGILTLLFALIVQISFAQEKTVSGTVSDETGPLPGVSVLKKGTASGTETDFDGNFSIKAKVGDVLVFSFVGMKTQEKVVGGSNTINVELVADNVLDEVVVVGYGTTTKQSFTGTADVVAQENLEAKSFSNVSQALTGEVAGVNVINTSGQPGTVGTIRIRGYGSVNGNRDPLYVVDGVPFEGSINQINPGDIKSTTILKDATATAIYGSRGANGVVLITTKNGSTNNSYIELELRTSVNDQIIPRYNVISSPEEYIGLVWEGLYNKGVIDGVADPVANANNNLFTGNGIGAGYNMWNVDNASQLIDPNTKMVRNGVTRKYTPLRYVDESLRPGIRQEANLRLGGGADDTKYFASFGYLDDNGVAINSNFKRYTTRFNIDTKIRPWLKFNSNLGYAYSKSLQNGQTDGAENLFEFSDKMAPIYPVFLRDENGNRVADPIYGGFQYDYGINRPNANSLNPLAAANYDKVEFDRHDLNASFNLNFELTDYLSFETRFGAQYAQRQDIDFTNGFYGSFADDNGRLFVTEYSFLTENFLQLLRFNKSWGDHTLEALAAHESFERTITVSGQSKKNMASPYILELSNFIEVINQPFGYNEGFSVESYFGQLNYNFADKYFLSASLRTDGSSRFINDKWGTFGSVGASWILSKENFLNTNNFVKFLKLKASFGIVGDQDGIEFYDAYDTFNVGNLANNVSISPRGNGNPDLTWETSNQFQVGTEFTLSNFLDGSIDYFDKRTDNLIFERRVGPSQGIAIITVNDGELKNSGVELDFTAHLVNKENFSLDFNINGAIYDNEITRMPLDPSTGEEKFIDTSGAGSYGWATGRSIYDFYIPEWAGVDPADGAPMWYMYYDDRNNNGVYDAGEPGTSSTESSNWYIQNPNDAADTNSASATSSIEEYRRRVGDANIRKQVTKNYEEASEVYANKSAIPDIVGAFRLSGKLHNFDFSTQFTYSLGGYAYDGQYAELMSDRLGAASTNFNTDIRNRWQKPGDITNVPRLADGADQTAIRASSRFITSTDYLALNNVRLGYTLPKDMISASGIDNVNIWIAADNLFMLSKREGYFPTASESGASGRGFYAPVSTITIGTRIKF